MTIWVQWTNESPLPVTDLTRNNETTRRHVMYRVVGPLPFGLPVSDANHHHSYRASEDEGQAGLHFFTQRVHEGRL
ncbi:hypothetical protein E2C01_069195 [Portunus trituberculatus]|uniref:Uncharacterized protein n=1 Tax=Portunus trituberculatus TaxID=210409 RepID=A0A5B7HYQ6_PORTR|nr:hypothetical protein [Portunus trituberculatus]